MVDGNGKPNMPKMARTILVAKTTRGAADAIVHRSERRIVETPAIKSDEQKIRR